MHRENNVVLNGTEHHSAQTQTGADEHTRTALLLATVHNSSLKTDSQQNSNDSVITASCTLPRSFCVDTNPLRCPIIDTQPIRILHHTYQRGLHGQPFADLSSDSCDGHQASHTWSPLRLCLGPVWSPNGKLIAAVPASDPCSVQVLSSETFAIVDSWPSTWLVTGVQWSPNSDMLLVLLADPKRIEIVCINASEEPLCVIESTSDLLEISGGTFSPDGLTFAVLHSVMSATASSFSGLGVGIAEFLECYQLPSTTHRKANSNTAAEVDKMPKLLNKISTPLCTVPRHRKPTTSSAREDAIKFKRIWNCPFTFSSTGKLATALAVKDMSSVSMHIVIYLTSDWTLFLDIPNPFASPSSHPHLSAQRVGLPDIRPCFTFWLPCVPPLQSDGASRGQLSNSCAQRLAPDLAVGLWDVDNKGRLVVHMVNRKIIFDSFNSEIQVSGALVVDGCNSCSLSPGEGRYLALGFESGKVHVLCCEDWKLLVTLDLGRQQQAYDLNTESSPVMNVMSWEPESLTLLIINSLSPGTVMFSRPQLSDVVCSVDLGGKAKVEDFTSNVNSLMTRAGMWLLPLEYSNGGSNYRTDILPLVRFGPPQGSVFLELTSSKQIHAAERSEVLTSFTNISGSIGDNPLGWKTVERVSVGVRQDDVLVLSLADDSKRRSERAVMLGSLIRLKEINKTNSK